MLPCHHFQVLQLFSYISCEFGDIILEGEHTCALYLKFIENVGNNFSTSWGLYILSGRNMDIPPSGENDYAKYECFLGFCSPGAEVISDLEVLSQDSLSILL